MSLLNGHAPKFDNRISLGNILTIVGLMITVAVFFLNYEHRMTKAEAATESNERRIVTLEIWKDRYQGAPRPY